MRAKLARAIWITPSSLSLLDISVLQKLFQEIDIFLMFEQ